jgi:hypothetical protein
MITQIAKFIGAIEDADGRVTGFRSVLMALIKELCTERIVAVRHANGKDIWVIIHEYNSDAFVAYCYGNGTRRPR